MLAASKTTLLQILHTLVLNSQDIVKGIMDPSYVGKILIPNMGSIYKLSTINLKMMLIPSMGEIYKQSTIKCRNDANISY